MTHGNYVHEIFAEEDIRANRMVAALAYLAFFLPLALRRYSAFGRFHANQAAALTVVFVGNIFLRMFLSFVPALGNALFVAVVLLCAVFGIFGMLTAFLGKAARLPLIGGLTLL